MVPRHESTEQLVRGLNERNSYSNYNYNNNNIDLRYIKQTLLNTQATILIVDEKVSLVVEIRDDSKGTFDEATGLSMYSNSKAGVLSYASIFENLWLQTELYDQIKESSMRLEQANEQLLARDKMQKEFINVGAHELKTPIQPILSLTDVLLSQIKDVEQQELLGIIARNAKRLERLSDDILDVTKIEGKSLELNKEEFNLSDVVINAINDIMLGRDFLKKEKLRLSYNPDRDILIEADKGRISQVISNLLNRNFSSSSFYLYRLIARVGYTLAERSFSYHISDLDPIKTSGGTVRIIDSTKFPAGSTIAAGIVEVEPGGLREMHWHPNMMSGSIILKEVHE